MKQRTISDQNQLQRASQDLLGLAGHLPVVVTITEGKRIRSNAQNARHWADMEFFLSQIREVIWSISEYTGYNVFETRRIVGNAMPPEWSGIVYALKAEAAHDCLKEICGIPSSARLGTKDFSKFDTIREQTMSEIVSTLKLIQIDVMK